MTISQWQSFKRKPKWQYIPYQLGFSQFALTKTVNL